MTQNSSEFSLVGTERQGHLAPRKRHYPKQGIGIDYLVKMLELVRCEQQSGEVAARSPYRFKQATYDVLKWCIQKNLMSRREDFGKYKFKSQKRVRPFVFYCITDNGRKLLELIS